MSTRTTPPPMKFNQYALSNIARVAEQLDETGEEFTGKVNIGFATLTYKYDPEIEMHVITAIEPH